MFTLAMPQSEPDADMNNSASRMFSVKMDEDKPAPTALCMAMASSMVR